MTIAGAHTTLRLSATVPTGSGELAWFDPAGRDLAAWEHNVEVD